MKTIKISDLFISGTGVGDSDLAPAGISLYELGTGEEQYESLMFIGSGIVVSGEVDTYEERVDFSVIPGYFYIGDREFYAYNEKLTQVSHSVQSGEYNVISLMEFPDGPRPSYLDNVLYASSDTVDKDYGPSPIILIAISSGTLEDQDVPLDTVISSKTGINGYRGYRMDYTTNPSGTVISGEIDSYPAYFSPLQRFSKCYEYWREDNVISPDEYEYDFSSNSIVIHRSGYVDSEFIIEFEGTNEPFTTGLDLSPLVSYPEDSMICLSLSDSVEESPGSIQIYTSKKRMYNETTTIAMEVKSSTGNRLDGVELDIWLKRSDMTSVGTSLYREATPLLYESGYVYDSIEMDTGIPQQSPVYENELMVANDHRVDGKCWVRGVGYLTVSESYQSDESLNGPGYHVTAVTDSMGFAHIQYVAPSGEISTVDLEIEVSAAGITSSEDITLLSKLPEVYNFVEKYYAYEHIFTSGIVNISGSVDIDVPLRCSSPSSMELYYASDYLASLYSGADPTVYYPSSFIYNEGSLPSVRFSSVEATDIFIVKYLKDINITKLDGRNSYGS